MELTDIITIFSTTFIGLIALFVSFYFARTNKKREDDIFQKDLFKEFNRRYDSLNGHLYSIIAKYDSLESKEMRADDKNVLYDFFNLCAEEYYWYKKGRIDKKLWDSWNAGMNYWYSFPVFQQLWEKEISSKNGRVSYYLENGDEFFKLKP
jgi:hypothetical protein